MDGVRQHKHTAGMKPRKIDGESGNFGVEPFHQVNGGGSSMGDQPTTKESYGTQAKLLANHERGIGEHVPRGKGSMPAQRHPDHGPHMHREEKDGRGGKGEFSTGGIPR